MWSKYLSITSKKVKNYGPFCNTIFNGMMVEPAFMEIHQLINQRTGVEGRDIHTVHPPFHELIGGRGCQILPNVR
jgi:hypothetical protein